MTLYRAKGAMTNTRRKTVRGMYMSRTKTILGDIDVFFTSDKAGETISLHAEDTTITVPVKPIEKLIKQTRARRAQS